MENAVVDVDPVPPGSAGFLGDLRVVIGEAHGRGH